MRSRGQRGSGEERSERVSKEHDVCEEERGQAHDVRRFDPAQPTHEVTPHRHAVSRRAGSQEWQGEDEPTDYEEEGHSPDTFGGEPENDVVVCLDAVTSS
jgi:hypothetical protein